MNLKNIFSSKHLPLDLALALHGIFEASVGLLLLIMPKWVFPYIADRASYNNSERALLRWFAFNIVLQGIFAFGALLTLENPVIKRFTLMCFMIYHCLILLDAGFGYYLEGMVDEAAAGLHLIMACTIGFLLMSHSNRRLVSPKKR